MAEPFPLVINFEGDYGMKLFLVDPAKTLDQVAAEVRDALVGVLLRPLPPGTGLAIRRNADGSPLDGSLTVAEADLIEMEALDILHA